ncbi:MAG: glycosyltransferase family 4 protein [Alphaproteobacteria bacterium]
MRIAFYAPLKPPGHGVPSGDRAMARLLMAVLRAAGHEVVVASDLRAYAEKATDQAQIRRAAQRQVEDIRATWQRDPDQVPDLWFTYHLYYRAPDWIGPALARHAGIPYVVAEASFAMKRALGVWSAGHNSVGEALRQADAVFTLARGDVAGLAKVPVQENRIVPLAPFVDVGKLQKAAKAKTRRRARSAVLGEGGIGPGPLLLAVGMMRHRAKLESYQILAGALGQLGDIAWTLGIVGDGPARGQIEKLFAGMAPGRVRFLGAVVAPAMAQIYRASDIFAWPGVGEAYGMVYLEAQACGVPVIAMNCAGVANVVQDGKSGVLVAAGDVDGYRNALAGLIGDRAKRRKLGRSAAQRVAGEHGLAQAVRTIDSALGAIMIERR